MSVRKSSIRTAAPASERPSIGAVRGNGRRKRGRPALQGRTRRIVGQTLPVRHETEDGNGFETNDEGLDPAFDEFGELADHLDSLSMHLRSSSSQDRDYIGNEFG